jgi:hypothetical protein
LLDWYKKDPSIEQDLVPIKSCKTCAYQYGFNDLTCLECCQLSNWKEVEPTKPLKTEDEGTTINSQGAGLLDGLTAPDFNAEIDRIMAEMETAFLRIMNRIELMREVTKCQ